MPKINVYLPDDLAEAVKDAGVPVSAVCQRALELAVRRVTSIREVVARPPAAGSELGPFTKRAMTALLSAQRRADAAGRAGTGHLLAALADDDNMAVRVLGALEISPRQVRAELSSRSGGDSAAAASSQLAKAVELAAAESLSVGNGSYIGCEHLLLGLIGEPDGVAGTVLRSLGADLRVTRRTVAAALAGWGAGFAAYEQRAAEQGDRLAAPAHADFAITSGSQIADQVAAVIKSELAPVLARVDRLEALTAR